MGDDVDLSGMNVLVSIDEVSSDNGTKQLGRSDRMLFGHDVDCVLHGIGSDHNAIIGLRVAILVNPGPKLFLLMRLTKSLYRPAAVLPQSSREHLERLSARPDALCRRGYCPSHIEPQRALPYLLSLSRRFRGIQMLHTPNMKQKEREKVKISSVPVG